MISEKNNVLLNISENLTDLQQKLEQEKIKISEEMVKQKKTIHRLKLRNSQLREKLARRNSLMRRENEKLGTVSKDDSGRESDTSSSTETGEWAGTSHESLYSFFMHVKLCGMRNP